MSTLGSWRRPPAVVVVAVLCGLLALVFATGAVVSASAAWEAWPTDHWVIWTAVPGALLAAGLSAGLTLTIGALLRGEPRTDVRVTFLSALVVASALVFGLGIAPWAGLAIAASGAAIAVLVNQPPVGRWLARR